MLDFPLPDKPESINHGSSDGFNFGGSLGFVYEAMGVHSSVICGKKQVEDVGRDEMVSCNAVLHELQLCVSAFTCMVVVTCSLCLSFTAKLHGRRRQSLRDYVACLSSLHLLVHISCSQMAVVCIGRSAPMYHGLPRCSRLGQARTGCMTSWHLSNLAFVLHE